MLYGARTRWTMTTSGVSAILRFPQPTQLLDGVDVLGGVERFGGQHQQDGIGIEVELRSPEQGRQPQTRSGAVEHDGRLAVAIGHVDPDPPARRNQELMKS